MRKYITDCWKDLNPKFIISTGRTGTKFLSNFFNMLSSATRSNPSMDKFKGKSAEDVALSYINLNQKIGAKGLIIPKV